MVQADTDSPRVGWNSTFKRTMQTVSSNVILPVGTTSVNGCGCVTMCQKCLKQALSAALAKADIAEHLESKEGVHTKIQLWLKGTCKQSANVRNT